LPIFTFILLFLLPPIIYLQDLSDWTFQSWLFSKYITGEPLTHHILKQYPVPNSLVTVVMGGLATLLPIFLAEKIMVALTLLAWAALLYRLCRQRGELNISHAWIGFVLFALASNFWSGYLNFNIGALVWCFFLYRDYKKPLAPYQIVLFSVVLFFCHAIVYAVFFVYAFFVYVSGRYDWRRWLALVPSLLLCAAYLVGRYMVGGNNENIILIDPIEGAGPVKWLAYKVYTLLKLGPFQNYLLRDGQSFLENYTSFYWVAVALSALTLAILLLQLVRVQIAQWSASGRKKLFWLGMPLALLLPPELFGVVNPTERIIFLYLIYAFVDWALEHSADNRALESYSGNSPQRLLTGLALLFLCYNAVVLAAINLFDRRDNGFVVAVENPSAVLGTTRLPYFSHALFAHSEKLEKIKANDQQAAIFTSGLFMERRSERVDSH
jgi:hypothetical protein